MWVTIFRESGIWHETVNDTVGETLVAVTLPVLPMIRCSSFDHRAMCVTPGNVAEEPDNVSRYRQSKRRVFVYVELLPRNTGVPIGRVKYPDGSRE